MTNAVWVYFRPGFNPPENPQKFLSWSNKHDVKLVLLSLDGKKYASQVLVEPEMEAFIQACVTHGLEVHGMFNALTSVPDKWMNEEHKGLFCVDYHGISILDEPISNRRVFMDPNRVEVVELLQQMSLNILKSYPQLSGIQLDFIRYYHWKSSFTINAREMGHNVSFLKEGNPLKLVVDGGEVSFFPRESSMLYNDPPFGNEFTFERNLTYCFCDHCLTSFSREYNLTLPPTSQTREKADWIYENALDQWLKYRCNILESALRKIHQAVKGMDATKQLSITTWYNYPYGNELLDLPLDPESVVRDFGQNWWDWVNQGLLDFVCPMNYWLKPASFEEVIRDQLARLEKKIPLYSGLLRWEEYDLDSAELENYKAAAKRAGATGISFFHYGTWQK